MFVFGWIVSIDCGEVYPLVIVIRRRRQVGCRRQRPST